MLWNHYNKRLKVKSTWRATKRVRASPPGFPISIHGATQLPKSKPQSCPWSPFLTQPQIQRNIKSYFQNAAEDHTLFIFPQHSHHHGPKHHYFSSGLLQFTSRVIFLKHKSEHVTPSHNTFQWLSIVLRITKQNLHPNISHKALHYLAPAQLSCIISSSSPSTSGLR